MPIWRDEPENIVGVLHTKDLLSALGKRLATVGVAVGVISLLTIIVGLITPIVFAAETKSLAAISRGAEGM